MCFLRLKAVRTAMLEQLLLHCDRSVTTALWQFGLLTFYL
jgi:hypothetical protein